MTVQMMSPRPGVKVRIGREMKIEWQVRGDLRLAAQKVSLSLDGGKSFITVASDLAGNIRSLRWFVPDNVPKTRRALLKVVVTDANGAAAEGVGAQVFRIK